MKHLKHIIYCTIFLFSAHYSYAQQKLQILETKNRNVQGLDVHKIPLYTFDPFTGRQICETNKMHFLSTVFLFFGAFIKN